MAGFIFPIAENSVPANKPARTIKPFLHTPKWIKISPFHLSKVFADSFSFILNSQ
jgi:hypothetical protein